MSATKADELKAKVAPADEAYALMGSGVSSGESHHGRTPHHDQPTFPAPYGVSKDALHEQRAGHLYAGVGPAPEDDDEPEVVGA